METLYSACSIPKWALDWLYAPAVLIRLIRYSQCIWYETCTKHCTTLQEAQQSSWVKCTSLTVNSH